MNQKQEIVFNEIKHYYENNRIMPTIRYLQKKCNYKSTNSIYKILIFLEKEGYITRNNNNDRVILLENKNLIRTIEIINSNKTIKTIINNKVNYIGYIIKNNFFIKMNICKGDILIIEKTNKLQNNDLGLFIIDNKYQIMQYCFKNGFYILTSNETFFLNKVKIIGKVVTVIRQIKTLI